MNEAPTFTGTEVGYYFICKKKLWWFAHGVEMRMQACALRTMRSGSFENDR